MAEKDIRTLNLRHRRRKDGATSNWETFTRCIYSYIRILRRFRYTYLYEILNWCLNGMSFYFLCSLLLLFCFFKNGCGFAYSWDDDAALDAPGRRRLRSSSASKRLHVETQRLQRSPHILCLQSEGEEQPKIRRGKIFFFSHMMCIISPTPRRVRKIFHGDSLVILETWNRWIS